MAAARQPAGRGLFESAVVVSNDTDLVVPVRMVTGELERPVSVVCQKRTQVASQLRNAATHVRNILASMPAVKHGREGDTPLPKFRGQPLPAHQPPDRQPATVAPI